VKPQLTVDETVRAASVLLGASFRSWQQAAAGADHLVIFATLDAGEQVVLKAGLDADVDAAVLERLAGTSVAVPRLLAHTRLTTEPETYWLAVMTLVEGTLLADIPDAHRHLPQVFAELRKVHVVTSSAGAGLFREVNAGASTSWQAYLLDILTGQNPEFRWAEIARSPWVDASVLERARALAIDRVRALPDPPRLSLLHGDLNPYNIFVGEGRITGIIDWSYARFGDELFDYARLRMNPFIRSSPEATTAYHALLSRSPAEQAREETYYLVNLIEYVNWYVLDERPDGVRELLGLLESIISDHEIA
jgi:aminoglycoside phosphotransferase (APT) family kinase protein